MKASLAEQKQLLSLQAVDTTVAQLNHRTKNLPQNAEIAQLRTQLDALRGRLATETGTLDDTRAELSRLESDVQLVEARVARNTERLQQTASAKDVQAFEQELASLKRRRDNLEEMELVVMERAETDEAVVNATRAEEAELTARIQTLEAEREAALDRLSGELGTATGERNTVSEKVTPELLALYEKLRARGGFGAALFRAGTCGACNITFTGNDLQSLRGQEIDAVVQCPECNTIVVRTEESGLW